MQISAVIVEDEQVAMARLERLLNGNTLGIKIVDRAYNGLEAIKIINQQKPEIVFLDINIPGKDGIEIINEFEYMPFIIFVTAYDQYALEAFEKNSIDFLLKPVSKERLDITLQKVARIFTMHQDDASKANLRPFQTLESEREKIFDFIRYQQEKIAVKTADGYQLIKLDDITCVKAEDKYVRIYALPNSDYLTDFTLSELEQKYGNLLLRIHRNTLVNKNRVVRLKRVFSGHYKVVLDDGTTHEVSKRSIDKVKSFILKL